MKGIQIYNVRLKPIYKNEADNESIDLKTMIYTNPKYPTYMICGAAGNPEVMETEDSK
jgi:hypothetical protein